MKKLLLLPMLLVCLVAPLSYAQDVSVEGLWNTFDDDTGQADSLVKIWIDQGELKGKIIKLIEPEDENAKCVDCEGKFKDQTIVGLQFIWGLTLDDGVWDDGNILDPSDGSVYSSKITLSDDGNTLDVRGYIGFAFAGQSTVWKRAVAPATAAAVPTLEH